MSDLTKQQIEALKTLNKIARHIGFYEGFLKGNAKALFRSENAYTKDEEITRVLISEMESKIMELNK